MEMTQKKNTKLQFRPDDYVSYGSSGVCRVMGKETCSLHDDEEETYYKLCPVDGTHSTYYIPVKSAGKRLRPLLTKEEIYRLIDEMADQKEQAWCNNSHERRDIFQGILHSDDYRQIIQMMRTLHQQKERKRSTGHKLAAADEAVMRTAETRMYQEFGIVLGIRPDQVHDFIMNRLSDKT